MHKIIFFIVMVVSASLCMTCAPHPQPRDEEDHQKKENFRQQVLRMSSKYGADLDWTSILDMGGFFTLDLQQALLEPPGQSHLVLAPVVDVIKRDNAYFITAHYWMADIFYQLECDEKQAQYVMNTPEDNFRTYDEYAIVIKPTSVHKPVAQLVGEIDIDYARVIHDATDIVIVKGICVDILSLEDSGLHEEDLFDIVL